MTQIKTAENQMFKPQLCADTIFIAKKYLVFSFWQRELEDSVEAGF